MYISVATFYDMGGDVKLVRFWPTCVGWLKAHTWPVSGGRQWGPVPRCLKIGFLRPGRQRSQDTGHHWTPSLDTTGALSTL